MTSRLTRLGATPQLLRAEADGTGPSMLLYPGEDFDGDGNTDLVGVNAVPKDDATNTITVAGVRGSTGEQLWTHSEDASYAVPIPTRVGPNGDAGVLVLAITEVEQGSQDNGSVTITIHLTALSGSGATLWGRTDQGQIVYSPTGVVATGVPIPTGVLHADDRASLDLLLLVEDAATSPTGDAQAHATADVVNGNDGTNISQGTMDATNREPVPYVTGDLSGDGRDDYAFVASGQSPATISARGGLDGGELWNNAAVPVGSLTPALDAGDVTGDGREDVLLWSLLGVFGPGGPVPTSKGFLLDGADGHTLWSRPLDFPAALGDVNGLPGSEIDGVVWVDTKRRFGLRYVAYDATGHTVYSKSYTVPTGGRHGNTSSSSSLGVAGDVDADGIEDFQHRLSYANLTKHRRHTHTGIISGRTGALLWPGLGALALDAAVDGTGDDVVRVRRVSASARSVAALHGNDGTPIWVGQIPGGNSAAVVAFGVDVNGDGLAEVMVESVTGTFGGQLEFHPVMLSAQSGDVLWSG
jgi:hypothetical protein